MKQIEAKDLKERMDKNRNLVVIEALPSKYYAQGHLPNAVNMPLEMTDEEIKKLLPDTSSEIITYCSSSTCPNSGKLAERLSSLGYRNVVAFEAGKEGWTKSGFHLNK